MASFAIRLPLFPRSSPVIPAFAGIQDFPVIVGGIFRRGFLDSRFRGNDDCSTNDGYSVNDDYSTNDGYGGNDVNGNYAGY